MFLKLIVNSYPELVSLEELVDRHGQTQGLVDSRGLPLQGHALEQRLLVLLKFERYHF